MKYISFLIILCILLTGCGKEEKISKEVQTYQNIVEKLKSQSFQNTELPCHLEVSLEKSNSGKLMYTVTLDEPKEEMYQVKAVFISLKETENSYPSIGIFDENLNMIPNQVDQEKNIVKGIVLVGYLKTSKNPKEYHDTFRLYLEYQTKDKKIKTVYYEKKI